MKLTKQIFIATNKTSMTTKFNLVLPLLFLFLLISCKENSTEPTDSEKPTVTIIYPSNTAEVKADTVYKVIANATDNKSITKVEFYIDGQNVGSDSLSPYEFNWNTSNLSGDHTIMAKGYDDAGNVGNSPVVSVKITGSANLSPNIPSNPNPLNGVTDVLFSTTLNWSCSDPEGYGLAYDVYFGTSSSPTTSIAIDISNPNVKQTGLRPYTTYYWKVVARDNKDATTTG